MKFTANRLLIAALVISAFTLWSSRRGQSAPAQRSQATSTTRGTTTGANMIRLYTGPDGQSHLQKLNPKLTLNAKYGREESEHVKVGTAYVVSFPPGYVQDWHPATARRYVITLSGLGEVELADGEKIPLPPGSILQADDVTGKGHVTRTVGNEPWSAFFVEFNR